MPRLSRMPMTASTGKACGCLPGQQNANRPVQTGRRIWRPGGVPRQWPTVALAQSSTRSGRANTLPDLLSRQWSNCTGAASCPSIARISTWISFRSGCRHLRLPEARSDVQGAVSGALEMFPPCPPGMASRRCGPFRLPSRGPAIFRRKTPPPANEGRRGQSRASTGECLPQPECCCSMPEAQSRGAQRERRHEAFSRRAPRL